MQVSLNRLLLAEVLGQASPLSRLSSAVVRFSEVAGGGPLDATS